MSDFHKWTAVSLKSQILKALPKQNLFGDLETFNQNTFNNDLESKLHSIKNLDYSYFEYIVGNILNACAPIKTKILRAHEFMRITLRKNIMTRSTRNVYLKNQNTTNWNRYKFKRNSCNNLLRKIKEKQN